MTPYIFQRGETISLALDAVTGDPLSVTAMSASMKAVAPGRTSVSAASPVAAVFTVAPRAAQGNIPPGWNLTIDAASSAALQAGSYMADARLQIGGGVVITESVAIAIRESVSG
ncbi:MAG: hypothetical protein IBJ12_08120 [Sphingomonadaceae bacterium]|nr:hypothetical protein [Sphingomonadaceae bacterium]